MYHLLWGEMGMKFLIYRPDLELDDRMFNKNYLYDLNGNNYFQYIDKKNRMKQEIDNLKEIKRKRTSSMKIEVPND